MKLSNECSLLHLIAADTCPDNELALLLILKVLFGINQSSASVLCFSLWGKHGVRSKFFTQNINCDGLIGRSYWATGSTQPCVLHTTGHLTVSHQKVNAPSATSTMILVHAAHTKERHTGDFGLLLPKGNASSAVSALILVHAAHNKVRQIDLGCQQHPNRFTNNVPHEKLKEWLTFGPQTRSTAREWRTDGFWTKGFILQLYCPIGISPMRNLGCFP